MTPVSISLHLASSAMEMPSSPANPQDNATQGEARRKPLYVLVSTPAQMRAGPNYLVLRRAGVATAFYPVARIAYVVCNHHLTWSGDALLLCILNCITITWVDECGHAVGHLQNPDDARHPANTLIKRYLRLPDWTERFNHWLVRQRRALFVNRSADWNGKPFPPEDVEAIRYAFVHKGLHEARFPETGKGWCQALAVNHLHRNGLRSVYWGADGNALELAQHLSALLWADLNFSCGVLPVACSNAFLTTRFFETWARQHTDRLPLYLGSFKLHAWRELGACL
jgi:hypothetical protein